MFEMRMKNLVLTLASALAWNVALAADTKVDFKKDILPILEQNCNKCHGEEKQKGKLRLDSRDAALKGGKGGPALVAGDPEKSEMIRRISLPKTDDDFMPSEGEPLKKEQIELLKEWIKQGAVWPEGAATAKAPGKPEKKGPALPTDFKPGPNETKAVAKLAESGIDVRPIAANVPWREANLRLQGTNATDATLAQLKDVTSLVDLNLATTRVTDAGLENLKGLTYLMRLHLELTGITDAGLAHLKPLTNLVYLNLYNTKVTDAGMDHLKDLKHLRNLYVWQTKVTDSGVAKLKEALPGVDVSTGWDLKELAKIEEAQKAAAAKRKEEEEAKKKAEKEKAEKAEKEKKEKAATGEKKDEKKPEEKQPEKKEEKKDEKKETKPAEKKENS
jgi:hypothetical protein